MRESKRSGELKFLHKILSFSFIVLIPVLLLRESRARALSLLMSRSLAALPAQIGSPSSSETLSFCARASFLRCTGLALSGALRLDPTGYYRLSRTDSACGAADCVLSAHLMARSGSLDFLCRRVEFYSIGGLSEGAGRNRAKNQQVTGSRARSKPTLATRVQPNAGAAHDADRQSWRSFPSRNGKEPAPLGLGVQQVLAAFGQGIIDVIGNALVASLGPCGTACARPCRCKKLEAAQAVAAAAHTSELAAALLARVENIDGLCSIASGGDGCGHRTRRAVGDLGEPADGQQNSREIEIAGL